MGEPLVNKNIYKMIKYASEHKISTLISTNFNLFNEEHIDDLFNSKLTVLEPCLDGFTQESYAKYRVNGHVDLVKRGIQLVMDHKRKTKSRYPIVNVQIVLFDHIKHEIGDIEVFLKHNKVDQITYREENLGFNSPETTIVNRKGINRVCFWLYIGMMIRPDGNVYPCDGRGFNRFSYGSILKQDIAEIWNNKYFRFSRSLFTNGSDLDYDEEMRNIPCLSCKDYIKRRNMLLK
jgi:radical SAM protein with 4Fe4S-binding SPASM domain